MMKMVLQSEVMTYQPNSDIEEILMNLPEIQAGRGLWQNRHHQHDVYGHSCAVVIAIKELLRRESDLNRKRTLIAGACLHDIAKPKTAKEELRDGEPIRYDPDHQERTIHRFIGHEQEGKKLVQSLDSQIFLSLDVDQETVADLVGAHYDPMTGIKLMRLETNPMSFVNTYIILEVALRSHQAPVRDILELFYADRIGQGEACKDQLEILSVRDFLLGQSTLQLSSIYANMQRVYHERDPSTLECVAVDQIFRQKK